MVIAVLSEELTPNQLAMGADAHAQEGKSKETLIPAGINFRWVGAKVPD